MISVIRTSSENIDFENLVNQLNSYLKIIDGDDHAFYNQYNNIDVLKNVIIVYVNEKASGCGAFKVFDKNTVEIKRMYTCPESREKGVASKALNALENWARELGYRNIILETGKRQVEAVNFYKKMNYTLIANFGPYKGVENSLCFKKELI
ncbi:GNAT family N-acetyltransferase [Algibacter aquimarinus]|uniref:N-acetyltransferase domain-containing protein n=1 Tax=Algibacter aquimarinus TaxID=1136748 RepID=A0ABP9HR26_9FLAO